MLHRLDGFSSGILIFIRGSLTDELFARLWMLALAQAREIFCRNTFRKAELLSKLALPLPGNDTPLRPVILLLGGELYLVIVLRLASGERFGNRQHGGLLHRVFGSMGRIFRGQKIPLHFLRFCGQRRAWHNQVVHRSLVESKAPFIQRFEDAVGQACESAAASRVARHFGLAASTVRAIDQRYLQRWAATRRKSALRQMGVDEIFMGKKQKFIPW